MPTGRSRLANADLEVHQDLHDAHCDYIKLISRPSSAIMVNMNNEEKTLLSLGELLGCITSA